jgi:hypothetical protein
MEKGTKRKKTGEMGKEKTGETKRRRNTAKLETRGRTRKTNKRKPTILRRSNVYYDPLPTALEPPAIAAPLGSSSIICCKPISASAVPWLIVPFSSPSRELV